MPTVVFADSRGVYLSDQIYNSYGEDVVVCYYRGVTLEKLRGKIWTYTRSHVVNAAYIHAGVNNITTRNPYTGECQSLFESPGELRDHLMDLYIDLLRYCYDVCGINNVIISTLTGISLWRYNRSWMPPSGQWVIDWGVRLLNEDILALNGANNYHTPCLHHAVHITQHHPYRCREMYNRLRDGLHPSHKTLTRWANSMVGCMRLNNHL